MKKIRVNKKIWKRTMQVLGLLILCAMGLFSHKANKSREMTFKSTLNNNQLGPCGEKPNCVSSFMKPDQPHFIQAHPLELSQFEMVDEHLKDCELKDKTTKYRHFECSSSFFKFVDDVELLHDSENSLIHFRSASRVGHSDLDANRKRINKLKNFLKDKK
jgi:uncharacterized protein (DUF1499 family)